MLGLSAVAVESADTSTMGSHSLRIGGATALYHHTDDLKRVRRFGRWQSGTFHSYLWEAHEHPKSLAENMANDAMTMTRQKRGLRAGDGHKIASKRLPWEP